MTEPSASELADRALELDLLTERQLQEVWGALGSHEVSSKQFQQHLVRHEYLTNYQVERMVRGERTGFFYGDYMVTYLLGAGTFARVYRAVHRETRQNVAVKVLRKRYSENPKQAELFVREGNLGRALRHPNIVPIYEVHSKGSTLFLVMEFVEGLSLRDLMKIRKKFDPLEATRITVGIASGLRYAFEHGLTHRDLKMSNVLVSSRGEPKLVDFGLATIDDKTADDTITEQTSARTIDYAALERATGVRRDDTRSDIYFLGSIYYHMLVGTPPLSETADRLQRLSRGRFADVVPIEQIDSTLPQSVVAVVNKAMALDPMERYQTPAEMVKDLGIASRQMALQAKEEAAEAERQRERERRAAEAREKQKDQRSVMVVESNVKMQDVFRSGLKRAGYRVLLTSDPHRALQRFRQDVRTADGLILNAHELGRSALDVFHVFTEDPSVDRVPVILLVDRTQAHLVEEARTTERQIVVSMPVTMKQLRASLGKLLPAS